jgi:hypothetical protein
MNTHDLAVMIILIFVGLTVLAGWTAIYGRGARRRAAALAVLAVLLRRRN